MRLEEQLDRRGYPKKRNKSGAQQVYGMIGKLLYRKMAKLLMILICAVAWKTQGGEWIYLTTKGRKEQGRG
jgi:hypothetical protein